MERDTEQRLQEVSDGLRGGTVTIDAAREAFGLEPLPDGEGQVYLVAVRPRAITLVRGDDWQGLYVDGRLVNEGHRILEEDFARALGVEVTFQRADEGWLEDRGDLPRQLTDVVRQGEWHPTMLTCERCGSQVPEGDISLTDGRCVDCPEPG